MKGIFRISSSPDVEGNLMSVQAFEDAIGRGVVPLTFCFQHQIGTALNWQREGENVSFDLEFDSDFRDKAEELLDTGGLCATFSCLETPNEPTRLTSVSLIPSSWALWAKEKK